MLPIKIYFTKKTQMFNGGPPQDQALSSLEVVNSLAVTQSSSQAFVAKQIVCDLMETEVLKLTETPQVIQLHGEEHVRAVPVVQGNSSGDLRITAFTWPTLSPDDATKVIQTDGNATLTFYPGPVPTI